MLFSKRGQVALEYIMLIGVLFLIAIPIFYYSIHKTNTEINANMADDAMNTLGNTIDMVYAMGPGTKEYVRVTIPPDVHYTLVNGTEILLVYTIHGGTSELAVPTIPTVVGSIPSSSGTHKISIEALSDGRVRVGPHNDTKPPEIIWTYPRETISFHDVTLKATTNEYATCKYDLTDTTYDSMGFSFTGDALTHEDYIGTLSDGTYTYYARCNDTAGNVMSYSQVINFTIMPYNGTGNATIEHEPPIIKLINPPNGYTLNTSDALFEYNVTDVSPIFVCKLIIDESVDQSDTEITRNITMNFSKSLDRGNYTWSVNCTDSHGNEGNSTTWNLTINSTLDLDNPIVNLISPENSTTRNFNFIYFRYNVTDLTSAILKCAVVIQSFLDSGGEASQQVIDSSVTENQSEAIGVTLDKGNHTWYINCTDDSSQRNIGMSEEWQLRINTTQEEAFVTSCAGWCGFNDYIDGSCRQNAAQCRPDGVHESEADPYCTGGPQADTCCCITL